jgi:Domain of unknown function (DUF4124)/Protein of unknown function (DUF1570)
LSNFRSWMIFTLLCLLSISGALWLQRGTDARPFAAVQQLSDTLHGLFGTTPEPGTPITSAPGTPPTSGQRLDALNKQRGTGLEHAANDQQICNRPPTKSRTDTGTNLIYKWIDEDGQTHLSDTPPTNQIASVIDMAGSTRDFTYSIQADGVSLPLPFEGQVTAGSKRIYDTWHFFLGAKKLRQSKITLRVIGGPGRYDSFRAKARPNGRPSNGFYSPAKNEAYVKYNARHPEQTIRTSFHEISHLVTASHLGPTPPWLTEGLAEYFETMEVKHQGGTIYPNQAHISLLRKSHLPRLHDFLSVSHSQWSGADQDLNYAMAWSLMHFLMQGAPGIYAIKEVVEQAHTSFCKPFSAEKALHDAYPGGLQRLEADWKQWMTRRQYSIQQI